MKNKLNCLIIALAWIAGVHSALAQVTNEQHDELRLANDRQSGLAELGDGDQCGHGQCRDGDELGPGGLFPVAPSYQSHGHGADSSGFVPDWQLLLHYTFLWHYRHE
jgi:hypothetical protein